MNIAIWREVQGGTWQYITPLSVIGTVRKSKTRDGMWRWVARVMWDCQEETGKSPSGYAPTFEGARLIVEVLCKQTGTID